MTDPLPIRINIEPQTIRESIWDGVYTALTCRNVLKKIGPFQIIQVLAPPPMPWGVVHVVLFNWSFETMERKEQQIKTSYIPGNTRESKLICP